MTYQKDWKWSWEEPDDYPDMEVTPDPDPLRDEYYKSDDEVVKLCDELTKYMEWTALQPGQIRDIKVYLSDIIDEVRKRERLLMELEERAKPTPEEIEEAQSAREYFDELHRQIELEGPYEP